MTRLQTIHLLLAAAGQFAVGASLALVAITATLTLGALRRH